MTLAKLNNGLTPPRILSVDTQNLPLYWVSFAEKHRVRLHLALLSENVAGTGKLWPATSVLDRGIARGDNKTATKAIDSTSGGFGIGMQTAINMARSIDPDFPIRGFVAVVSRTLPKGKRAALEDRGIELVDAADAMDAMRVAEQVADDNGYWYTRQYWNEDNSAGYRRVAEHIAASLPQIGIVAWGVGSGGGCSGIMPVLTRAFAQRELPFHRVAVVVESGSKIGGVRDEVALEPGTLPWRAPNIDGGRFVGEDRAYSFSAALWRQDGLKCGPSTGFAAEGALLATHEKVIKGTLEEYRADDGFVHVLAPSMDLRDPYEAEFGRKNITF